jgi:hypothetical protein
MKNKKMKNNLFFSYTMDSQTEPAVTPSDIVEEKAEKMVEETSSIAAAEGCGGEGGASGEQKDTATEESAAAPAQSSGEQIDFKIVYNKKKYDITFGLDDTVGQLKAHLQDVIGVPSAMQKIMIKGRRFRIECLLTDSVHTVPVVVIDSVR